MGGRNVENRRDETRQKLIENWLGLDERTKKIANATFSVTESPKKIETRQRWRRAATNFGGTLAETVIDI